MRSLRAIEAPALSLAAVGLAAASLAPSAARADASEASPSADLRGYRVPADARGGMYVEPASTPDTGDFSGGIRFNYAFRPIVLHASTSADGSGERRLSVIEHQLTADLFASMGFFRRFSIGFDLPVVVAQTGDDLSHDAAATKLLGPGQLPLSAVGDPGIDVKLTLVKPPAEDKGAALGIFNRLTIPLGDPSSFLGEGSVTDEVRALFDGHFASAFTVHLTAGAKFRGDQATFACGGVALNDCLTRFGHEMLWAAGLELDTKLFKVPNMTWFAELRGYLPIAPISPFESRLPSGTFASVSARYAVRDVSFFLGPEFALDSGVGNAPFRITIGIAFAPRNHDRDGDGIDDDVDKCPDRAEDPDGVDDQDGCPEVQGEKTGCGK
jgi:OOP family OmpA-OmpF porin